MIHWGSLFFLRRLLRYISRWIRWDIIDKMAEQEIPETLRDSDNMAEQELPEFLRDLDPASALAIARLQLPDLQTELAILRAARDEDEGETDEERVIQEESEVLQQAITALHATIPKSSCVVCEDIFENPAMATTPCDHKFCRNCLQELFQRSQIDESLFPPRCCESMPLEQVRGFLTPELIAMHEEKKVEFETVDRTYCSDLQCHRFLRPENITRDLGICPACNKSTCTVCKTPAHEGGDCPRDASTQAVLRYGTEQGWRRCFSCRSLVEIAFGCNHITYVSHLFSIEGSGTDACTLRCRCGSEFCYRCGLVWDTCPCPLWNNARQLLLPRPRRLNGAVVVAPQPPPVAVIRQAAAPHLIPELDVAVGIEALRVPLRPAAPPAQLIIANAIPPPAEAPLPPAVLVVAPQHAPAAPPQAAQPRIIAPQNDGVAPAEVEPVADAPRNDVPNVPQLHQPQAVPVIWDIAQQPNIAHLLLEGGPCNHVGVEWEFAHGQGNCSSCNKFLPTFLLSCGRCGDVWCRRCTEQRIVPGDGQW